METKSIIHLLILFSVLIWRPLYAQDKPEWRFSVLASVSEKTADFYGGLENTKEKIKEQFKAVNKRYNDPDVFEGWFNFSVDSVKVFSGSPAQQYNSPLSEFDYQIVYDMYSSPRANWIGAPIRTVALHIPYADGYPDILSSTFVKVITHELGHARGGVDLYGMAVGSAYNEVNNMKYEPEESIMSSTSVSIWCEHSINIFNYNKDYVLTEYDETVERRFDSFLGFKVVGTMGEAINNAEVKLFPHGWYDYILKADYIIEGKTDGNGVMLFKNNPYTLKDLYYYNGPPFGLTRSLMLALITYNEQEYYLWLPFTLYQNMYFSDDLDTALVTIKVESMPSVGNDIVRLFQNFPNPFNNTTEICLEIKQSSDVNIDVYNVLGQKEQNLFSGTLETGLHCYNWDGAKNPTGIYFVTVSNGKENYSKKMLLLK